MLRTVDQVRVLPRDMNFDEGLTINNVSLGGPGAFSDVETVRDAINSSSEIDYRLGNVFAFVDDSGALVISTENGEGIDIAGKNVLNVNACSFSPSLQSPSCQSSLPENLCHCR